ncbi:thioredoxin domain-containing protein [Dyadobacter sp. 676]|uniref:Thioredoxin domain-containing protein n=1 Tax=Dyadobacter sp. 676 TaxID=3088362 RepID=A0AAU8FWU4_9BACT
MAECTGEQGKFWETYRELFKSNGSETADVGAIAKNVGLDIEKCNRCISSFDDSKMLENFRRLNDLKLNGTPTILINNRIYFGELTLDALSQHIDQIAKQ